MPRTLLVHPGTQHSPSLAKQLWRIGCLSRFWTGAAYVKDSTAGRILQLAPQPIKRSLSHRLLEGVPASKLRTRPLIELRALKRLHCGHEPEHVMYSRNNSFQRSIPEKEIKLSEVVIGFDTSSWLLAERSREAGRPFVLDRSIAHRLAFQEVAKVLRAQFPDWAEELSPDFPRLTAAEDAEHCLAHRIVVASSFTRKTLLERGVAPAKIAVNPYGVDLASLHPKPTGTPQRSLRFLFLGHISARKGVPLLIESWRSLRIGDSELWLAGSLTDRQAKLIPELKGLRVLGKVSRPALPALLAQCDVLVFPSYFEGFGLVLLEAMAAGLPIVATDATGAPDLITDGVEGYTVPVGDLCALSNRLQIMIDSPADLAKMSLAARKCAERYSWDAYGDRWLKILEEAT